MTESLLTQVRGLAPRVLLCLSLLSGAALVHPGKAASADLQPAARAQLAQAAADPGLAAWQRDLMLRLARGGTTAATAQPASGTLAGRAERSPDATDGDWVTAQPTGRSAHSAMYDPVRDRMVVFGGSGVTSALDEVWTLSLAGTPTWELLSPSGSPPSQRASHTAIYDAVRDRMVVFGGFHYGYFNDVWVLSLGDAPVWTQLTPTGTPPDAREAASAIYDPVRDRMLVFGGYASTYYDDVWALSLSGAPAWTLLAPTGTKPSARVDQSAVYDPVRDRMLVFGGYDGSGLRNDVWALSLAGTPAWAQLAPAGTAPTERERHGAVYDPVRDRMLVYGGEHGPYIILGDAWALSLAGTPTWSQLVPAGTLPGTREDQGTIYDPVRDRMVVFGGYDGDPLHDTWALSLADTLAWAQLPSAWPGARAGHTAVHDPLRRRMVVFGGTENADVWVLSLAGAPAWTLLTPTGTPPSWRYLHSAVYDPVRDRMLVFGGESSTAFVYLNDVWALSLAGTPAWAQLEPSGTPPRGRERHSTVYDPVRDRMLVFGGYASGLGHLNDVWALTLADTLAWKQLSPTGAPPSTRSLHSSVYDPVRDRMLVFGGDHGVFNPLDDAWVLSLAGTPAWAQLSPSGTLPPGRCRHVAVYDPVRDRMVVHGGYSNSAGNLGDTWELSLSGEPAWAQLVPAGASPSARRDHRGIYDPVRDHLVLFGGYDNTTGSLDEVWKLEWSTTTAVERPLAPPPASFMRPPAPNPTRGTTAITFALARPGRVRLGVYDVGGRLVRRLVEGERNAGTGTASWDGTDESGVRQGTGIYFVRLAAPGVRETRRIVLLR